MVNHEVWMYSGVPYSQEATHVAQHTAQPLGKHPGQDGHDMPRCTMSLLFSFFLMLLRQNRVNLVNSTPLEGPVMPRRDTNGVLSVSSHFLAKHGGQIQGFFSSEQFVKWWFSAQC